MIMIPAPALKIQMKMGSLLLVIGSILHPKPLLPGIMCSSSPSVHSLSTSAIPTVDPVKIVTMLWLVLWSQSGLSMVLSIAKVYFLQLFSAAFTWALNTLHKCSAKNICPLEKYNITDRYPNQVI